VAEVLESAHRAPARPAEVLSVRGLAKRFGQRPAVVDVSLDLAPAEVLGFVGPNGAGKTTTLRILAGLLRPDAGQGHVLGHDIMASGGDHRKFPALGGETPSESVSGSRMAAETKASTSGRR